MQLGKILEGATERIVCKPVTFRVLGIDPDGAQVTAQAEAVFAFVTEGDRAEALALAAEKPGPEMGAEETYYFLLRALRDKDNPRAQFCPDSEVAKFKAALILDQVQWLKRQYQAFVQEEYPELATKEQREQILDEAAGK